MKRGAVDPAPIGIQPDLSLGVVYKLEVDPFFKYETIICVFSAGQ